MSILGEQDTRQLVADPRPIPPVINMSALAPTSSSSSLSSSPASAPPGPPTSQLPERSNLPTRSSTMGDTPDGTSPIQPYGAQQSHSEDLNHVSTPSPPFLSTSRPSSPGMSRSSSGHSDDQLSKRMSTNSLSSVSSTGNNKPPLTPSTSSHISSSTCAACGKPMQGAFVRALGTVYHLNCFKCQDCGDVVASKFFPIDGQDGKQYPLCERDYFRRLNLICAKCGMALRGSYITACNNKYHVEHFTCSICPTLFGPQDSYYEHEGNVYCHFHYSTRFATKCAGCNSAILKQFVEINRNQRDECWHPECYMINKFWNVKVARAIGTTALQNEGDPPAEPPYAEEERRETHVSLKEKQFKMEQLVYRVWTVLSAFEESSAACISDMLRQVSNGQYLDAIRMAEKFILHVEVLFAAIDDLEFQFNRLGLRGMSHVREARMLCRKTVDLFELLSHTQETGQRRMGMTQELLSLVTGLAHYLKILIRIALTGALKLERDQSVRDVMGSFLDKLHLLAVQGGNPTARRMLKGSSYTDGNHGTQGVTYGFRSLAPESAGESPFGNNPNKSLAPPTDLCVTCKASVEEDCVRLGTYLRWHSHCIKCRVCGRDAAPVIPPSAPTLTTGSGTAQLTTTADTNGNSTAVTKPTSVRRPPANASLFLYLPEDLASDKTPIDAPSTILCIDHQHQGCRGGFQPVTRLEQYAYLLNVALRKLHVLLKKQGVVPLSPAPSASSSSTSLVEHDPYRNSGDIMRMKSVHLDRKLSATARLPKRSTVIESPAGKSVQPAQTAQQKQGHDIQGIVPQQRNAGPLPNQHSPQPGQYIPTRSPPQPPSVSSSSTAVRSTNVKSPGTLDMSTSPGQMLRPAFARNNTGVMIVDDSVPSSPAAGTLDEDDLEDVKDDGITLADIPQLMEAAQAREQQRSLPRQGSAPFIAELNTVQLAIVKHCAFLALQRSLLKEHVDLDELLELIEVKKNSPWFSKWFKGDKKNVKKKGVFGIPLEFLVEKEGSDSLLGASRQTLRVPSFIDDVVSAMRQMDMSVEGIFRKNGNIRRLRDLTDAIDRDPSSVDLTQDNPVQLAALLKKFLRDLPDPLMTFKLHRLLISSQSVNASDEERKRLLHMVSLLLPKSHRDTMEVLFVFLKWVASFAHMDAETGSKMDLGNLATVICPSILYSRGRDPARDESFGAIRVVTCLLENQDEFYVVPDEFLPIIQDYDQFTMSLDLPTKEFMKKCDIYMRTKANGRLVPMSPPMPYSTPVSRMQTPQTERPPLHPVASDNMNRNGNSRTQSPLGARNVPMAHPQPGLPPSLGQGAMMMQQQPQHPNPHPHQYPQQPMNQPMQSDPEWSRSPVISPSPRPTSWTNRPSGEFVTDGRQRI